MNILLLETTKYIVVNKPTWLDIIEILINFVIAAAAIWAVFTSLRAVKQTQKFKEEESDSRRGWVAPVDDPGNVKNDNINEFEINLEFQNFGINPIDRLKVKIYCFNISEVLDNKIILTQSVYKEGSNMVPNGGRIQFTHYIDNDTFTESVLNKIDSISPHYLGVKIQYRDIILNKIFSPDYFYWSVEEDGELLELKHSDAEKLRLIIEKDFYKNLAKHPDEIF